MAKTQDLKRRIRSVKNTMQLTRAMKMVSAAKLRRAQDRILAARPYARSLQHILRSAAARTNPELHALLQTREGKRAHVVVVTADRGLCGAFNAGILRATESLIKRDLADREVSYSCVGRKGREYLRRRGRDIRREWTDVFRNVQYSTADEIGGQIIDWYQDDEQDEIYLAYNEFKSAIQATPVIHRVLPVDTSSVAADDEALQEYLFEPNPDELMNRLLPHYVRQLVFQAMIESAAAEHAARMTAMDSATNNAGELIESLTLTMNRVRQASITTEIIEVVSGAEALG